MIQVATWCTGINRDLVHGLYVRTSREQPCNRSEGSSEISGYPLNE